MLHPDMAREIASQRAREMQSQARQRGLARNVRAAARARRRAQADGTTFVPPVIPDYVEDIVVARVPDQRSQAHANRTTA